jgi:branched-chain amino acid transport system ATP-binding protein
MCMLDVSGLSKSFGAIQALNRVDLRVETGRIHGIIGPNGSGKTTLFNCITGVLAPEAGTIRLEGEVITGHPAHAIAGRGIRHVM